MIEVHWIDHFPRLSKHILFQLFLLLFLSATWRWKRITLIRTIFSTLPGIPYALSRSGFWFGLILLVGIAALTDYSLCILIKAGNLAGVSTYQVSRGSSSCSSIFSHSKNLFVALVNEWGCKHFPIDSIEPPTNKRMRWIDQKREVDCSITSNSMRIIF